MDGEAHELEDPQVVRGRELAEPPAEVGLVEEAGLERQAPEGRARDAGRRARPAAPRVSLDPVGNARGRRRLLARRLRREQRHLVLGREEVELLHRPHLVPPARRPGIAGGDEEEPQTSFSRCPSLSRLVRR